MQIADSSTSLSLTGTRIVKTYIVRCEDELA